jgi:hypothetical protein
MPDRQWQEWEFPRDADVRRVAEDFASAIVSVGLPWLEQFVDPAAVFQGLRSRQPLGFKRLRRTGIASRKLMDVDPARSRAKAAERSAVATR